MDSLKHYYTVTDVADDNNVYYARVRDCIKKINSWLGDIRMLSGRRRKHKYLFTREQYNKISIYITLMKSGDYTHQGAYRVAKEIFEKDSC